VRRPFAVLLGLLTVSTALALPAAAVDPPADGLRAGVGRADLTSPTGYFMQGWVRSDAVLEGVHARIQARAIVLERGGKKLALVAVGLNGVSGGVVADAADLLRDRGFSEQNIVVSASHTHAAPSGYYNYDTYNSVFMTTGTPTEQNVTGEIDPQLYAFEVRRLAEAIAAADDDLGPAELGWGSTTLVGVTRNRSLEAHLANHGLTVPFGEGSVEQDPDGELHTIAPDVQVLRVDKLLDGRYRPVGTWSTFANHGTVNRYTFGVYNDDHHGAATRVLEQALRDEGDVPPEQDVVNAYGNTDEGDVSAGLTSNGPAYAEEVGRLEAAAMLEAWRDAGDAMTSRPELDTRWTRMCFCGQDTASGPVAATSAIGLPLFTGSEEGRGPLFDVTQTPFEGRVSPVEDPIDPAQGHKIVIARNGGVPPAVPLLVAQVGERLVATVPGEMSVDMGRRVRAALQAAGGVGEVQLSGLANEYLSYFVTPEEYDRQHYEGGSQLFGRTASVAVQEALVALAGQLRDGQPPTPAFDLDPRNGKTDDAPPFPTGATSATALDQPATTQRLARAAFAWQGGERGFDMPAGTPFVTVERQVDGTWVRSTDDLGLQLLWVVNDDGRYDLQWEVPRDQPPGAHRFAVTANRYSLTSDPFDVTPSTRLSVADGHVRYPDAVTEVDYTFRPAFADGATAPTTDVAAGRVRDVHGNCNGAAVTLGERSGDDASADPAVCAQAIAPPTPPGQPASSLPRAAGPVTSGTSARALPATGSDPWLVGGALLVLLAAVVLRRQADRA
jgi:neutral ceramidase